MKLLVFASLATIFVAVLALTDQEKEKLKKINEDCAKETGVTKELVQQAANNTADAEAKDKLKKQLLCVDEKLGLITKGGDVDTKVLKETLTKGGVADADADKIVKECAVKKESAEDTAVELAKCLAKSAKQKN